jgi:hypothetical protein
MITSQTHNQPLRFQWRKTMSKSKFTAMSLCALMCVLTATLGLQLPSATAQDRPGGNNNGGPGGDRAGGGDREQMRARWEQRMQDRLKEALKVSDEEWSVLQPRIKKVSDLQRESRSGMMRGMGRRGGGPGGENNNAESTQPERQLSAMQQAAKDLQTILETEGATSDQIKAKLDAYRAAKTASEAQLTKARTELRELLTINQEAQLVMMGILE